ncbi:MAG: hypothetical protein NVS9B7_27760 [Flavisolibacter sp.]
MTKFYFLFLFSTLLLINSKINGQVGIGTPTPAASSMLEVQSTDKGLLIPRVALTATNVAAPITTPATSLLVYNTATTTGANLVQPGFYYWNGTGWVSISNSAQPLSAWSLTGNSGIDPNTQFISTTDNQPLIFKVKNLLAGKIDYDNQNTSIGIGSLTSNTSGLANTASGEGALNDNTSGNYNTASGVTALLNNTTGSNNTANGNRADVEFHLGSNITREPT